ncbi:hypothetical protein [Roseobacter sp. CCS2]|uniref:hypothetical protein n=1 Tax=Roseobacter sp. CCS2 TaxID=391593 RepID=UPI0000F3C40A|nr:hypothetical protein [Roseobacter sp. CCS2]EBA11770.1 hypothetical protein RCCS2_17616 [Roseobacter sp. CCS2]
MTLAGPSTVPSVVLASCEKANGLPKDCREKDFPKPTAVVNVAVVAKAWEGDPVPPSEYRASFPRLWARFLRSSFRNWQDVAGFFEVDDRTARNQWQGLHKPTGDKVAMAALAHPEAFRLHCGKGLVDE